MLDAGITILITRCEMDTAAICCHKLEKISRRLMQLLDALHTCGHHVLSRSAGQRFPDWSVEPPRICLHTFTRYYASQSSGQHFQCGQLIR